MIFQSTFEQFNGSATNNEDLLEGVAIADYSECGSVMEAAMDMMQESAINWENFNRAIATTEAKYLKENGVPMEYLEENVKELISGGIKIIQSWFSKAMGLIERAMKAVGNWVKDKVSFVKQHEAQLKRGAFWPKGKSFDGYDFKKIFANMANFKMISLEGGTSNLDDATGTAMGISADISRFTEKWLTGSGSGSKLTTANVKKAIMYGAEIKIDGGAGTMSAGDCIVQLKTARTAIDGFQEERKNTKKAADDMIKALKKIETKVKAGKGASAEAKKDAKDTTSGNEKLVHSAIAACNKAASANSILLTAKIGVYNDYIKQIDKIARVYVGSQKADARDEKKTDLVEKNARKANGESAIFGFDSAIA